MQGRCLSLGRWGRAPKQGVPVPGWVGLCQEGWAGARRGVPVPGQLQQQAPMHTAPITAYPHQVVKLASLSSLCLTHHSGSRCQPSIETGVANLSSSNLLHITSKTLSANPVTNADALINARGANLQCCNMYKYVDCCLLQPCL